MASANASICTNAGALPGAVEAEVACSACQRRISVGDQGGFGLWACLPDPKRALGAHGVPLTGEVRLRRTSHTPGPRGLRAGHTPPSVVVLVLGRGGVGHGGPGGGGWDTGDQGGGTQGTRGGGSEIGEFD